MVAIAYRIRSTLRSSRAATVGLVIVIAIVCGAVLAVAAGAQRTSTAADRYTKHFGGDRDGLIVQLEQGRPRGQDVAALPAVSSVDAYTFLFAVVARPGTSDFLESLVFAGSPAGAGKHVVSGRLPDPNVAEEFVATKTFTKAYGAQVGDRFDLRTYTQAQAEGQEYGIRPPANPPRPAVLVGVVDGPSEFDDPTPQIMFSPALIEPVTFGISQTQMSVTLQPGSDLEDLRGQLDGLKDGEAMKLTSDSLVSQTLRRAIDAQAQGLWLVALAAGIATITVLGQLITRHIRLTASERDRLATIGFTRRQIFVESVCRAAIPILLGAVLACAVSWLPSDIFPTGLSRRLEPTPGLRFDATVVILGAAMLMLSVLGWTAAAFALDQRPPKPVKPSSAVEAVAAHGASAPAATGLRFAFTGKTGERGSTSSAVAGVALIVGSLVAAAVFGVSLNRLVGSPDRYGANYDYAFGDNGGSSIDESLVQALRTEPDFTALTLYAYGAARVGSTTVELVGMQPIRGNLVPRVSKGRNPIGADEVALGLLTAHALHVDVGDSITMVGGDSEQPIEQSMHVTGIAIVSGFGPVEGMGEGGVVTFDGLSSLDHGAALTTAAFNVINKKPETLARLAEILGVPPSVIPPNPYQPTAIVNVARIRATPFVLAALLGGLAVLSVVHVMLTSLRKRRRDFAVLAALGADRGWIRRSLHWQATTFTVVPIVIGIPLGIVVGRLVFVAFADSLGAADNTTTPIALLAAMTAGLLLLANAAALPSWPAGSARPAEALQTG